MNERLQREHYRIDKMTFAEKILHFNEKLSR